MTTIAVLCSLILVTACNEKLVCTDTRTVVKIISVNYRDSTFIDERNEQHIVNQGVYKLGDKYCIRRERNW